MSKIPTGWRRLKEGEIRQLHDHFWQGARWVETALLGEPITKSDELILLIRRTGNAKSDNPNDGLETFESSESKPYVSLAPAPLTAKERVKNYLDKFKKPAKIKA